MKEGSPKKSFVKEDARMSTLNSQVFRQAGKDETRSSYLQTEGTRNSKVFTPVSNIPSHRSREPLEESSVHNFYKHNNSKN